MSSARKEEESTTMPSDLEAVKILLENAEIEHDEDNNGRSGYTLITLANGIVFEFDQNENLLAVEPE